MLVKLGMSAMSSAEWAAIVDCSAATLSNPMRVTTTKAGGDFRRTAGQAVLHGDPFGRGAAPFAHQRHVFRQIVVQVESSAVLVWIKYAEINHVVPPLWLRSPIILTCSRMRVPLIARSNSVDLRRGRDGVTASGGTSSSGFDQFAYRAFMSRTFLDSTVSTARERLGAEPTEPKPTRAE